MRYGQAFSVGIGIIRGNIYLRVDMFPAIQCIKIYVFLKATHHVYSVSAEIYGTIPKLVAPSLRAYINHNF